MVNFFFHHRPPRLSDTFFTTYPRALPRPRSRAQFFTYERPHGNGSPPPSTAAVRCALAKGPQEVPCPVQGWPRGGPRGRPTSPPHGGPRLSTGRPAAPKLSWPTWLASLAWPDSQAETTNQASHDQATRLG